ncbi:hypothetical protein [Virgibacillus dokdonensis]|uniref:hypothetical protein n=1 Tax=Virgibacillus dokdonensis TaxID=302167 RepID=UPI0015909093|nr:hypothetical protein [Virgibacillus dokdonensis]
MNDKIKKELDLELFAEELPEKINYTGIASCWGSAASFACFSCPATASCASTGACASG